MWSDSWGSTDVGVLVEEERELGIYAAELPSERTATLEPPRWQEEVRSLTSRGSLVPAWQTSQPGPGLRGKAESLPWWEGVGPSITQRRETDRACNWLSPSGQWSPGKDWEPTFLKAKNGKRGFLWFGWDIRDFNIFLCLFKFLLQWPYVINIF